MLVKHALEHVEPTARLFEFEPTRKTSMLIVSCIRNLARVTLSRSRSAAVLLLCCPGSGPHALLQDHTCSFQRSGSVQCDLYRRPAPRYSTTRFPQTLRVQIGFLKLNRPHRVLYLNMHE